MEAPEDQSLYIAYEHDFSRKLGLIFGICVEMSYSIFHIPYIWYICVEIHVMDRKENNNLAFDPEPRRCLVLWYIF